MIHESRNPWEELQRALARPQRPAGSKSIGEIASETGATRSTVERKMKALVESGEWECLEVAGVRGLMRVYWPKEQKHGTGRNRARAARI